MARETKHAGSHTSRPEWVVAIISGILVLLVLGYTTYDGITRNGAPPLLQVQVDSVTQTEQGFMVAFTVSNRGDETAADVHIEGVVQSGDAVLERSAARLDFVPIDAQRSGALLFTRDPRRHALHVRTAGFQRP
jgi:uncharacterized protein (TIGR02588 family)